MADKKKGRKEEFALDRIRTRVSVRFNYVLFPLDLHEFQKVLQTCQFASPGEMPAQPEVGGPDVRTEGQGVLAVKGDYRVDVNTDRQFFGVAGGDPIGALNELLAIVEASKPLVDAEHMMFFEMQGRYRVRPGKSPMVAVRNLGKGSNLEKKASNAFGTPLTLYSARLVHAPNGPNSSDYFEFWFQPTAALPDRVLGLSVLFRSKAHGEFISRLETVERHILGFVEDLFGD